MLKAKYATEADIPEGFENLYTEKDGAFVLIKIEGLIDGDRLAEFRDNNKTLATQIEEANQGRVNAESALNARNKEVQDSYGHIDLDVYQANEEKARALEEKKLIDSGQHEELLNRREDELRNEFSTATKKNVNDWTEKESGLTSTINGLNGQLSTLLVDNQLSAYAAAMGVLPTALSDVLSRGRSTWTVVDGQATARDAQGHALYSDDATTPLDMAEWISNLSNDAPHLFATSNGSGEDIFNVDDPIKPKPASENNNPVQNILEGLDEL